MLPKTTGQGLLLSPECRFSNTGGLRRVSSCCWALRPGAPLLVYKTTSFPSGRGSPTRPAVEEWERTAPDPLPQGPPWVPSSCAFRRQSHRLPPSTSTPHPAQNSGAQSAAVILTPGQASELGLQRLTGPGGGVGDLGVVLLPRMAPPSLKRSKWPLSSSPYLTPRTSHFPVLQQVQRLQYFALLFLLKLLKGQV